MVKFIWFWPLLLAKASFGRPFGEVVPDELGFKLCGTDDIDGQQHARDNLADLESTYSNTAVFKEHSAVRIPVNVILVGNSTYRDYFRTKIPAIEAAYENYRSLDFHFGPFTYDEVDEPVANEHMFRIWGNVTTALIRGHRRGGADTLNVFVVPANLGTFGFANFPWNLQSKPGIREGLEWPLARDAVVVAAVGLRPSMLEKLMVHETGHWLGLYHTFQGGCTADGDKLEDTPQHDMTSKHANGCDDRTDSCPKLPGLDPVRNFMTYTGCTEGLHFTAGQARRMREAWDMFRDPKTRQIPEYSQAPLPVMSRNESRQLMDLWMEREPRSWRKIRFSVPFNFTGTGNETKLVELPRLGKPGKSLQRNP